MSTTTNAPKPLTVKGVKNTLDRSTLAQAKRSPQVHVLPAGSTRTLCAIDTAKWAARDEVAETTVNCPLCAETLKDMAKKAKEATV